jgi:hypothetical protein
VVDLIAQVGGAGHDPLGRGLVVPEVRLGRLALELGYLGALRLDVQVLRHLVDAGSLSSAISEERS